MSAPMDISMSKPASDAVISEENGGNPKPEPSASSPTTLAGDKVIVSGICRYSFGDLFEFREEGNGSGNLGKEIECLFWKILICSWSMLEIE